jgi:hypothetical protein
MQHSPLNSSADDLARHMKLSSIGRRLAPFNSVARRYSAL